MYPMDQDAQLPLSGGDRLEDRLDGSQERSQTDARLERALERLTALHEGYAGVTDVMACGQAAVPALQRILAHTESSGIFEPRCRAISALMALGAVDALINFLETPKVVDDPTARLGEEAVMSTAARALKGVRDAHVFRVVLKQARRRPLGGVIETLGSFRFAEAIPGLIYGLYEDETRKTAVTALRRHGRAARPALIRAAGASGPSGESSSSLRARRAALALLVDIRLAPWQRADIRPLIWDADPEVSAYACRACMNADPTQDRDEIARRLSEVLLRLRSPVREVVADWVNGPRSPPETYPPALVETEPPAKTRPPAERRRPQLHARADRW